MLSSTYESSLVRSTVKGQIMSMILKFSFLKDLGVIFAKYDQFNLASLYIFKYNLGELARLRHLYNNRENILGHPDWSKFCQSTDYNNLYELMEKVISQNENCFENSFNTTIPIIQQRYGPTVSEGICKNLGTGPMAQINPKMPEHEIKTNWLPRLTQNKTI